MWHFLCKVKRVEARTMIKGTITARHIVLHPLTLISCLGFFGYFKLLVKCADSSKHCFTDFLLG